MGGAYRPAASWAEPIKAAHFLVDQRAGTALMTSHVGYRWGLYKDLQLRAARNSLISQILPNTLSEIKRISAENN